MMAPVSWAVTGIVTTGTVWLSGCRCLKDFMISSLPLYDRVPGSAVSADEAFCQAFCFLLSHLYAPVKKGIFVWEEVDANAGLIEVTVQSCSCYDLFVVMSNSQREGIREVQALSKNLVMFTFLCEWAPNDGSYSSQRSPRAHPTGQWIIWQWGWISRKSSPIAWTCNKFPTNAIQWQVMCGMQYVMLFI